jgi:serine/threonine protein kinase
MAFQPTLIKRIRETGYLPQDFAKKFDSYELEPLDLEGTQGQVYRISNEPYAVKFYHKKAVGTPESNAANEYMILSALIKKDFPIPKLGGLYLFNSSGSYEERKFGKIFPGLVMEHLDGENVSDILLRNGIGYNVTSTKNLQESLKQEKFSALSKEHKEKLVHIVESYWNLIRACKENGFSPGDKVLCNAIYNPDKDKLYLIDFVSWEIKPTIQLINR